MPNTPTQVHYVREMGGLLEVLKRTEWAAFLFPR